MELYVLQRGAFSVFVNVYFLAVKQLELKDKEPSYTAATCPWKFCALHRGAFSVFLNDSLLAIKLPDLKDKELSYSAVADRQSGKQTGRLML